MQSHSRSNPGLGSGPPRYPGSFLLAFREAAAKLNWQVQRWLGNAVEALDAEGRHQVVGLENLYRSARREDRADWPEFIATFLGSVQQEQFAHPPENLDEVADRLLVRLGPPLKTGDDDSPQVWAQPLDGTDLCFNLVVDYPQSMFYVNEPLVTASSRTAAAWLEQALANLGAQTPADCLQVIHEESGLRQCNVGDAYDSSRALLLDQLLPEARADGCFVALPGRDELLVLPVNAEGLAHVPLLKTLAEKGYKGAPYAISDEVFWVREGKWHRFPINVRGNQVTVEPPAEFLPILQRLVPAEQFSPPEDEGEPEETP
jgi:hypothetical protein